jgi:hypothetical protein
MSRIAPGLLATLALLGATTANASSHHQKMPPRCPPHRAHAHVLKADRLAELYTAPEDPEYPEFLGVYGCAYKNKSSYLLGNVPEPNVGGPGSGAGVSLEVLTGTVVADWYADSPGSIAVRNLVNGRVLHRIFAPDNENIGPVSALVVKRDGAVAWISEPLAGGPIQVHAVDKTGSRLLASSEIIEPKSLALMGSTLYWAEAGKRKSAVLH